jgi:predicted MFS family arabinose efflux permease
LMVTCTQIGYCLGLLFIVPLADVIENKRLIITLLILMSLILIVLILTNTSLVFLVCCFLLGVFAVAAQIVVTFVAHFTPLKNRVKVVGNVMSGLLCGIMLSRPIASWASGIFNWKAIFVFSAIFMFLLVITLFFLLPTRHPSHKISYQKLICSLPQILKDYPILRRRAIYHAVLFGIFSMFWTSVALVLMGKYHYQQTQVALFAFAGAAGIFIAPLAGRIADLGWTSLGTGVAVIVVGIGCLLAKLQSEHFIVFLLIAALLIDAGASFNLVLGQRIIFALAPEIRGRLNGLYMALFFIGGAIGSGVSGYLYAQGGWNYITNTGIIMSVVVFVYFLGEYFYSPTQSS